MYNYTIRLTLFYMEWKCKNGCDTPAGDSVTVVGTTSTDDDGIVYGKCYRRIFEGKKSKVNTYTYIDLDTGDQVSDQGVLRHLKKVKVPPTYTSVILCPDPRNDLVGQAVDGKGKLQYFYSEKHRAESNREKNCNLIHFGGQIEDIMSDIGEILEDWENGVAMQDKLALHALALRIMTLCHFRPGSSKNIRKNGTYGLTTLGSEHLEFLGADSPRERVRITFSGKKSQVNSCVIQDPFTIGFLRALNKHKGKLGNGSRSRAKLLDFPGRGPSVTPSSLNDFLQEYHPSITTKTWRTWFANISYIQKQNEIGIIPETIRSRQILSNNIIRTIAEELHHTLAVNKRNYLIPELEALFVRHPDYWMVMSDQYPDSKDFLMAFLSDYCNI